MTQNVICDRAYSAFVCYMSQIMSGMHGSAASAVTGGSKLKEVMLSLTPPHC